MFFYVPISSSRCAPATSWVKPLKSFSKAFEKLSRLSAMTFFIFERRVPPCLRVDLLWVLVFLVAGRTVRGDAFALPAGGQITAAGSKWRSAKGHAVSC
jgi:hypothetical protein